jgi:DNA polymerase III alpha subunit
VDILRPLSKTELNDRTLWFDGTSSYPATGVLHSHVLFVDKITTEIKQYNQLVPPEKQIRVKETNDPLKFKWLIPDEYKELNVRRYVIEKLIELTERENFSDKEKADRAVRVSKELKLYENHALIGVLRVLIFIINTLNNEGVVWGVGRGSSVSSYVLYLIGVHDVDSVKYELDIADFLH